MRRFHLALLACLALCLGAGSYARAETRLALVIAEGREDATEARDAGIVARALAQAGFEVTGHVALERAAVLRAFDDFEAKARRAGPETLIFVYLAGQGVQVGGDNYFVPMDATIAQDADVPTQAIRLADVTRSLAAIPLAARIVVLDLARAKPVARLAAGLAAAEPVAGAVLAYNAAPGTVADAETIARGLYAEALSEMMATPGLPIETLFARVRLRVVALSEGATMPWAVGALDGAQVLFPPVTVPVESLTRGTLEASSAPDAFWAAIARDTLPAYADALKAYPSDSLIARLSPVLAIRREALFWQAAARARTAPALWTYMRRYPRGPHFTDARRLLAMLSAALEPPPRFDIVAFPDLPPPKPDELEILTALPALERTRFEMLPAPPPALVPPIHAAYYDRPPVKAAPGTLPIATRIALGFAAPEGQILLPLDETRHNPEVSAADLTSRSQPIVAVAPVLAAPVPMVTVQPPIVVMPTEPSVAPVVVPEPIEPAIITPVVPMMAPVVAPTVAPTSARGPAPAATPLDRPAVARAPEPRDRPALGNPAPAASDRSSSRLPLPPRRPLAASPGAKLGNKKPLAVATKGKKAAPSTAPKGGTR